jgi:redox-sensitive bicupin YhaK (pirin superfamily)
VDPSFSHLPKAALPEIALPGVTMRLLAGTAFGQRAPTPVFSPIHYLALEMEPGAALELPPEHAERGVYAVTGELRIGGEPLPEHHLGVLPTGATLRIEAPAGARAMLLGGEPLAGDYLIWWNFVASSRAFIDAASKRWREQQFPPVPGETEFIPLPAQR